MTKKEFFATLKEGDSKSPHICKLRYMKNFHSAVYLQIFMTCDYCNTIYLETIKECEELATKAVKKYRRWLKEYREANP